MLCDVSTSVTSASVFFLSVLHALHDSFRKMRSFVFIERISEVTDVFEHGARLQGRQRGDRPRRRRRRHLRLHRLRPRLARVRATRSRTTCTRARRVIVLGDARTNGRDPRADVFAQIAAQGRAHVLAEPRAAAVLELRRLGDRRLRAALRGVRVLDDGPARGLRQGADAPGGQLLSSPTLRTMASAVHTEGLTKRYGETLALDALDLEVAAGRGVRLPRPERRRQDDDDPAPARAAPADERAARSSSASTPGATRWPPIVASPTSPASRTCGRR